MAMQDTTAGIAAQLRQDAPGLALTYQYSQDAGFQRPSAGLLRPYFEPKKCCLSNAPLPPALAPLGYPAKLDLP